MDYEVKTNDPNISTTLDDGTEEKKWSVDDLYKNEFNVETLVDMLHVIDSFKRKYPNDEIIKDFEGIVREEICQLFGGTTIDID